MWELMSVCMVIGHFMPHFLCNIGALIIRIGFGGILDYSYNKEAPNTLFELLRPLHYLDPVGMEELSKSPHPKPHSRASR